MLPRCPRVCRPAGLAKNRSGVGLSVMSTHSPLAAVPSPKRSYREVSGENAVSCKGRRPISKSPGLAQTRICLVSPRSKDDSAPRRIEPIGLAIFLRSLSWVGRESKRAPSLRPQRCGLGGCTRTRDLTLCVEDQRMQRGTSRIPKNILHNGYWTKPLCKRNIEMTPLCKVEVTLRRVLGSRRVRRGGGVDEQAGVQPA
jgi:hypothetical protein